MIAIFDYGAGNLRSVENTLGAIGASYELVNDTAGLEKAAKIILPGVGHFGQLVRSLDDLDVRGTLIRRIDAGVPFLGICLGLQVLFEESEESPEPGLGVFEGQVRRFPHDARVPHMGWNCLDPQGESRLLTGTGDQPYVYFANSYYVPHSGAEELTAATCDYTETFVAALETDNVFGVQFHPEKSGGVGQRIVKNFLAC